MAAAAAFDLQKVVTNNFVRKTVDHCVYMLTALLIALWVGQNLPMLTFTMFSYTSAGRDGISRDLCSPAPLLTHFATSPGTTILNAMFNNTFGSLTPQTIGALTAQIQKVQYLMLDSAGISAVPPFKLFSVPDRHYCLGPQHFAVAYDIPYLPTRSEFWQYVHTNRATIYASYSAEPWLHTLVITYLTPLWTFQSIMFIYLIYMLVRFWKYDKTAIGDTEAAKMKSIRIQPAFVFCFVGAFAPLCFNIAAAVLLALKLAGICLTDPKGIYVPAALHMFACILQWYPLACVWWRSTKGVARPESGLKKGTPPPSCLSTNTIRLRCNRYPILRKYTRSQGQFRASAARVATGCDLLLLHCDCRGGAHRPLCIPRPARTYVLGV